MYLKHTEWNTRNTEYYKTSIFEKFIHSSTVRRGKELTRFRNCFTFFKENLKQMRFHWQKY